MTASERPIPSGGRGGDSVYRRHGITAAQAVAYRRAGIPASAAGVFEGSAAKGYAPWLASTFSVLGVRAIAQRHVTATDVNTLMRLAEVNLSTLRGYVSQTRLRVSDIEWLMDRNVSCQATLEWTRRLPQEHRDTNLMTVLAAASILYGVPDIDLSGWVRFTNRHGVLFAGTATTGWTFLGGDTALMASAGLSPEEAHRMVRTGAVDRAALVMLSGLRQGTRGVR